jgi:hypothetical protein
MAEKNNKGNMLGEMKSRVRESYRGKRVGERPEKDLEDIILEIGEDFGIFEKMEKGGKVVNQKGPKPRPKSGMMNEDMGRMIDPNTEISDEEAARLLRMARMAKRGKNYAEGGEVNRDLGGFILDSYLGGVRQKDLRPQKIGSPPAKKSSSGATMPGRGGKFKGTK